jgi:P21-Rho-binding domain
MTTCDVISLDGKNTYSSKRKLRADMISAPQGDCKHMGHVGMDGAYFGDISFLGGKVNQVILLTTGLRDARFHYLHF